MPKITQLIPTIQGEGPFAGRPCLLVRFQGCNLHCPFCDTKWTNAESTTAYPLTSGQHLQHYIHESEYLQKYNINTILFTGGEPFLNKDIINKALDSWNNPLSTIKNIEIESNGTRNFDTIEVLSNFKQNIKNLNLHINISPKLDKNCHRDRSLEDILYEYRKNRIILDKYNIPNFSYCYKFIYDYKKEIQYLEWFDYIGIDKSKIFMMPLTPPRSKFKTEYAFLKDFRKSCIKTVEFCMYHNLRYSPREHIFVFGDNKNETI